VVGARPTESFVWARDESAPGPPFISQTRESPTGVTFRWCMVALGTTLRPDGWTGTDYRNRPRRVRSLNARATQPSQYESNRQDGSSAWSTPA
jgi:hypothetical protein